MINKTKIPKILLLGLLLRSLIIEYSTIMRITYYSVNTVYFKFLIWMILFWQNIIEVKNNQSVNGFGICINQ